jgi:hypothetical protein
MLYATRDEKSLYRIGRRRPVQALSWRLREQIRLGSSGTDRPIGISSSGINLVKLDPTELAQRAVDFRRQAAAEASSPTSHAERVSISDLAREASRGAGRPALGNVRWYRAARRRAEAAADDPPARERVAANAQQASGQGAARSARAAIAAYLANMPLAA